MKNTGSNSIVMVIIICACFYFGGCANLPLKEGGLEISKDTTVGIGDDIGVGSVTRQF